MEERDGWKAFRKGNGERLQVWVGTERGYRKRGSRQGNILVHFSVTVGQQVLWDAVGEHRWEWAGHILIVAIL